MSDDLRLIKQYAARLKRKISIMEVCGGHTNVIMRYGIRDILPSNIKLISGPGCPVCVSSQRDIDSIIEIAKNRIPVATYGDMLRVPGTTSTLEKVKAKGGNVFEVYSAAEVTGLKRKHRDIVFFGVGFETTAPMSAYLLKHGVSVYSVHKLIPPALEILKGSIDGFLDPGHVSVIIGQDAYKGIRAPQVITGFTPEHVLKAVRILLKMIIDGKERVENAYQEVVTGKGNRAAQKLLAEQFRVTDSEWRGLGVIRSSGLEVKDDRLNARLMFSDLLEGLKTEENRLCRCGDILKGTIEPPECPLYAKACTPEHPVGACMVSSEGSCQIHYSNI